MSIAVQTKKLTKYYRSGFWMRRTLALQDLDLSVQAGEVFGFVGPNGAGKTTTLKILAGLHEPSSGEAFLFSHPVSSLDAKRTLGFLPERPYFYVHLSPRELLHFYGQLYDMPKQLRNNRIEELLERMQMRWVGDVPMKKFSKGMLQRIGLCQTILHDPKLLILDEPMSGLDPLGRALVRDLILDEKEKGKTVFFSSHVLSDVESICSRVALLVKGSLRSVGTISSLLKEGTSYSECLIRLSGVFPLDCEFRKIGEEQYRFQILSDSLDHAVDTIRSKGGSIIEVRPIRQSLEELLVEEVQRDRVNPEKMGVWV
ncbi:MAG: ABC transporter ATP-binding protein [Myxococcota bacterium]|nr:ABC transporter ATP-binding protein [Myxococcota bacterium]